MFEKSKSWKCKEESEKDINIQEIKEKKPDRRTDGERDS
jgi:hypothetical protein